MPRFGFQQVTPSCCCLGTSLLREPSLGSNLAAFGFQQVCKSHVFQLRGSHSAGFWMYPQPRLQRLYAAKQAARGRRTRMEYFQGAGRGLAAPFRRLPSFGGRFTCICLRIRECFIPFGLLPFIFPTSSCLRVRECFISHLVYFRLSSHGVEVSSVTTGLRT